MLNTTYSMWCGLKTLLMKLDLKKAFILFCHLTWIKICIVGLTIERCCQFHFIQSFHYSFKLLYIIYYYSFTSNVFIHKTACFIILSRGSGVHFKLWWSRKIFVIIVSWTHITGFWLHAFYDLISFISFLWLFCILLIVFSIIPIRLVFGCIRL